MNNNEFSNQIRSQTNLLIQCDQAAEAVLAHDVVRFLQTGMRRLKYRSPENITLQRYTFATQC